MPNTTIEIEVDEDTAKSYSAMDAVQKKKMGVLLGLQLRQIQSHSRRSLTEIMDEIGARAARQGMTPEILQKILDEE